MTTVTFQIAATTLVAAALAAPLAASAHAGPAAAAPVPSSPTPFDVELGTNRAGHLVAAYSHDGPLHGLDIAAGTTKQLRPGVSGRLSDPTMSCTGGWCPARMRADRTGA